MRSYRASNHTPFSGFLLLLLLALVSGAALGGILWALDNYLSFYLIVVFPLFAGAIAGGLLLLGVRAGKVRSPFTAALMGVIAGLVIFGVYHFASYYVTFRGVVRDAIVQSDNVTPTDAQLDQAINQELMKQVSDTGFTGYLRYAAQQGFSITNSTFESDSSDDLQLQGQTVYLYWVVEIVIACGMAGWLAAREAGQPFDEDANLWYGSPTRLAITSVKSRKALFNALKQGDFQTAGSLLTTQEIKYPREEVLIRRSPAASGRLAQQDIYLTVNYCQRKGRTVIQRRGVVSPSELDLIERAMATQQQSPAVSGR